jgi:hypothetical protein
MVHHRAKYVRIVRMALSVEAAERATRVNVFSVPKVDTEVVLILAHAKSAKCVLARRSGLIVQAQRVGRVRLALRGNSGALMMTAFAHCVQAVELGTLGRSAVVSPEGLATHAGQESTSSDKEPPLAATPVMKEPTKARSVKRVAQNAHMANSKAHAGSQAAAHALPEIK